MSNQLHLPPQSKAKYIKKVFDAIKFEFEFEEDSIIRRHSSNTKYNNIQEHSENNGAV